MSIRTCESGDREAWDAYLATHEGASFYHLYDWLPLNAGELKHQSFYLLASDAQGVRGVLPLTLVTSRLFGRILCSVPFVNYGGPCASDEAASQALIEAAKRKTSELGCDYLELRCASPLNTDMPVSHRKISMTLELQADPDIVWDAFGSKHRKNIKRSFKNDLTVKSGGIELLPQFYSLMEQSWRALGTPLYSRAYFENFLKTFEGRSRIFVCMQRDQPVCTGLVGYFNKTVEGLWAGGNALARPLSANYALYWEMIKDGCLRGCTKFHLGRSTADSGGEEFKQKWNATAQQLHWYFHRPDGGAMPALNVDNPKYKMAIAAWRRLPLWTTRMLGPPLARLIP
jgi:FemAB-related protein (PEP-CTERM system-associated)